MAKKEVVGSAQALLRIELYTNHNDTGDGKVLLKYWERIREVLLESGVAYEVKLIDCVDVEDKSLHLKVEGVLDSDEVRVGYVNVSHEKFVGCRDCAVDADFDCEEWPLEQIEEILHKIKCDSCGVALNDRAAQDEAKEKQSA